MDEEKITLLMSITGCEKAETARFFLDAAGGDVEQAVNTYLESGGQAGGPPGDGDVDAVGGDAAATDGTAAAVVKADSPEEHRWYTGGGQGGSGQEVIAPGAAGADKVKGFMDAIQPHARQGTADDLETKQGAFSGSARTLNGQVKQAAKEPKKVIVKLYDNEIFTVNDGPPRRLDDPASLHFLDAIRRNECPAELRDGNEHVHVSILQVSKDWDSSERKTPTFEGTGRRLGGASSSSAAPPAQLGHPVTAWSGPDDSKPVTSVQLRFPDGSRLVGRFNHDQAVREIRSFVAAARPHDSNAYVMLTGFPAKQIEDESQTIADAGLINAVVTFKKA